VEKALELSDTNTQETLDRTTALQDRNLQGLAQSAKRFHTAASTAASMRHGLEERHSTWGGSEQGDLSDGTREHIERRNQLAIIEESQKEITIDMSFAGTSKDSIPISPLSSQLANTTPKALKDSSRHIQTVHGHIGTVRSVVFSPSGRILASGSDDATIKTWEVVKGGHLQQLQEIDDLGGMVSHLVFSPDGESLSAIIGGSEFRIWTLDSKNRLQQTKKQSWGTSRFLAIAFSPRSLLYTGLRDGRILEWHVDSTSNTPTKSGLDSPSGSGVIFISFDTDYKSQYLISGSEDGSIWIFKRPYSSYQADDTWSWTFSGRPVMALTSIAMLPDKRHLVIGSADRMLRCWTFRRYALLASLGRFKDGAQQKLCGDEEVCCVAASQGYQTTWIASGSEDHTVQLFNYNPSSETGFKKVDTLKGHSDTVCSVAFSPNGRRLISASADHTIRVWKLDE
jgi:WD40 repeat protein